MTRRRIDKRRSQDWRSGGKYYRHSVISEVVVSIPHTKDLEQRRLYAERLRLGRTTIIRSSGSSGFRWSSTTSCGYLAAPQSTSLRDLQPDFSVLNRSRRLSLHDLEHAHWSTRRDVRISVSRYEGYCAAGLCNADVWTSLRPRNQ